MSAGRWALAAGLAALLACGDHHEVARVGDTRISPQEIADYQRSHPRTTPSEALEAMINRQLFAEGAREKGLADDPKVAARIAESRRELLANALLDQETAGALTEKALRARYDAEKAKLAVPQVHVAQLVIRLGPNASAAQRSAAKAKINALYARLKAGAAFAQVAKEASEDPISAARGGDLGPLQAGQVDPQFFSAVAALKKGELSKPFETRFGLHLAVALDDPTTVVPTFEQVRGRLAAEARLEVQQRLAKKLAAEISVTRYPDRLAQAVDGGSR